MFCAGHARAGEDGPAEGCNNDIGEAPPAGHERDQPLLVTGKEFEEDSRVQDEIATGEETVDVMSVKGRGTKALGASTHAARPTKVARTIQLGDAPAAMAKTDEAKMVTLKAKRRPIISAPRNRAKSTKALLQFQEPRNKSRRDVLPSPQNKTPINIPVYTETLRAYANEGRNSRAAWLAVTA